MSCAYPILALQAALLDLGLGDADAVLDGRNKARDACAVGGHWAQVEPIWDVLRTDARFVKFVRSLGLGA